MPDTVTTPEPEGGGSVNTYGTYRKKPVEVKAFRWDGGNWSGLTAWLDWLGYDEMHGPAMRQADDSAFIHTMEGEMEAEPGDWIIRGVEGEFYPCKPDIFDQTYERVTEEPADDPT